MLSVQTVADWVARGADLYRYYVPPEWVPYAGVMAASVAVLGFVFAFWGARLLKTMYILAFMAAGAAIGFQVGSELKIDTLIGLTFGAAIAAFIGYVFYRWWVGVTTGILAVLLVVVIAWPRFADMWQGFQDYRQRVGSGKYALPPAGAEDQESFLRHFGEFGLYAWILAAGSPTELPAGPDREEQDKRREFARRFAFAAGLAWLLGVVMGVLLPKFTTVMGTSLVGVLLASGGIGALLYRNWPDVWSAVIAHPDWYLVGMAALLIVASWHQVRPGRVRLPAPPASPPPEAPPAPAK